MMAQRIVGIVAFYLLIDLYSCCPSGYNSCAAQDSTCNLSGENTIAYGADGFRWGYKKMTDSFTCNDATFGDPVNGIIKECCYQSSPITYSAVGDIHCNQQIHSFVSSTDEKHNWRLVTTSTWSTTFSNCGSDVSDTYLYLFDSAGQPIMTSTNTWSCNCFLFVCDTCQCDGDNCG